MLNFQRYSAVEVFGVPIDNIETLAQQGARGVIRLMEQYGIEPEPLPEGTTDITPYYGRETTKFSYWLTYDRQAELAAIELMPKLPGVEMQTLKLNTPGGEMQFTESETRTIRIPTDEQTYALTGPGPRYPGKLCFHEFILCLPDAE